MALVNIRDMLQHAYRNRYAVGAFDVRGTAFVEGVMAAAERCRAPVILSLAESSLEPVDFELLMPMVERASRRASVPVAIHFNRGTGVDAAVRAVNAGCNSVVLETLRLPPDENARLTATLVEMARGCGVPVEGELSLDHASVEDAKAYVAATGVDSLAVAIGTGHGRMHDKPSLDLARLKAFDAALGMPLVIHGGSSLGEEHYADLLANGVAKIYYAGGIADLAARRLRENVQANPRGGYFDLTRDVAEVIGAEAERCMHLCGSAEKADAVLAESAAWLPVEHLIVYNVSGIDEKQAHAMIAEGRRVLSTIPGVLSVVTGEAFKEDAQYRYTWLVRFCHAAVIDSYRDHPLHVAFADNRFRPVAGGRISIDYQSIEPEA